MIKNLSDDIIFKITDYLSGYYVVKLLLVCTDNNKILKNDYIWDKYIKNKNNFKLSIIPHVVRIKLNKFINLSLINNKIIFASYYSTCKYCVVSIRTEIHNYYTIINSAFEKSSVYLDFIHFLLTDEPIMPETDKKNIMYTWHRLCKKVYSIPYMSKWNAIKECINIQETFSKCAVNIKMITYHRPILEYICKNTKNNIEDMKNMFYELKRITRRFRYINSVIKLCINGIN